MCTCACECFALVLTSSVDVLHCVSKHHVLTCMCAPSSVLTCTCVDSVSFGSTFMQWNYNESNRTCGSDCMRNNAFIPLPRNQCTFLALFFYLHYFHYFSTILLSLLYSTSLLSEYSYVTLIKANKPETVACVDILAFAIHNLR